MYKLILTLSFIFLMCYPKLAIAELILHDDFEKYTSIEQLTTDGPWSWKHSTLKLANSGCFSGSKCVKQPYKLNDTGVKGLMKYVRNYNTPELYISMRFKVTGTGKGGVKFVKCYGKLKENPLSYANNTWNLGPGSSKRIDIRGVSYGAGHSVNDTQARAELNGTMHGSSENLVFETYTERFYPELDTWYFLEVYQKFNSNDQRDGVYWIKIDGVMKMHVTNVLNRNNDNIREFDRIGFGDWANEHANFDLWFDDITIKSSYMSSPTGLKIIVN